MYINNKKTLIICPPSMKQTAIEVESSLDTFNNVKIMSTSELKDNIFFSYSLPALIYICENYNYPMTFTKKLMPYFYYNGEKIICKGVL